MSFFDTFRVGASALTAQRLRLDTISNNIANAETTRTAEGGPYKRQEVVFTTQSWNTLFPALVLARRNPELKDALATKGVQVAEILTDDTQGPRVYDPTHPDADAEGFVTYPNVNIAVEMTNMLSATRSYEAGLAVIEAAKRMAVESIQIAQR